MTYNIMTKTELRKSLDFVNEERERLQQENEDNLKCIKSIKEQLESVINENQRLLKQWFENNDKIVELIGEKEIYYENFKDYKSRIEKAVKYIENTPLYETTYDYNMEEELEIQNVSDETASNKLLEILNGRSDV